MARRRTRHGGSAGRRSTKAGPSWWTAARNRRWRGGATVRVPLLWSLHLGYAWVAIGTAFLGLSVVMPAIPEAAAVHVYTAGAIDTMVLAVMTRVSLGHTGRPLEADSITALKYLMVTLSALTRIVAAFSSGATDASARYISQNVDRELPAVRCPLRRNAPSAKDGGSEFVNVDYPSRTDVNRIE